MSDLNATILDRVWAAGTNDYQQRIPSIAEYLENGGSTPDGIAAATAALNDPANNRLFNEFAENLIVLFGPQRFNALRWKNQLGFLKSDEFRNGRTVQEYGTRLIDPIQYDPRNNNFLKRHNVKTEVAFYGVNRRVVYPVTVNTAQLRQSLDNIVGFLDMIFAAVLTSNEYDEYRFMLQTLAAANQKYPFYNVHVPFVDAENPTSDEVKTLSRKIRATAATMQTVPNNKFNPWGLPALSRAEDLMLLTTPDTLAALDVEVLADAFNISKADVQQRVIVVDEFPWAGVHAMLIDRNAWVAGDFIYEMTTAGRNPVSLETNWYLHAQGGYHLSPMQNIAVFSDAADTNIGVVSVDLDSIAAHLEVNGSTVTTVAAGGKANLIVVPTGTVTGDGDLSLFSVPGSYTTAITADGAEVNPRTYVDSTGVLHVSGSLESGTVLEITVTAAYLNPSVDINTPTTPVTTTVTVTVA